MKVESIAAGYSIPLVSIARDSIPRQRQGREMVRNKYRHRGAKNSGASRRRSEYLLTTSLEIDERDHFEPGAARSAARNFSEYSGGHALRCSPHLATGSGIGTFPRAGPGFPRGKGLRQGGVDNRTGRCRKESS